MNTNTHNNKNLDTLIKQRQRIFEQHNTNIRINWEHYKAVLKAKQRQIA